jgi:perosamine synthetase
MIPYGRQAVDDADIQAVARVLASDWLTSGPAVEAFEEAVAAYVGSRQAVAVSSGTAALHAAVAAAGIGPGDEVILPPITFVASANAVVYQGATPVFADVDPETLLLDPVSVEAKLTPRTKAILGVDYAGQPCDYEALRAIARRHGLVLIADGCHALGADDKGRRVGTLADLTVFSFHPVKPITTGEGGMVTTQNASWADRMRRFRNHGITADFLQRQRSATWFYEVVDLGYNYRLTDIQSALGVSQLRKLPEFLQRRRQIARTYDRAFLQHPAIRPLPVRAGVTHAYHLYVVRLDEEHAPCTRAELFAGLRAAGIGVNVHYIPVHLHPFYRERFQTQSGQCPVAEAAYERILSLPIFPAMTDQQVDDVVHAVREVMSASVAR